MTISRPRKFSAFTLVELIVVITILAILATIGFLALSGYTQDAKNSVVAVNVRSVQTAITAESVTSGNSPRYYVVYDSGAALTGAFVYVDGVQTALTGGNWNDANTNYTAGNPDYVKLKLNPEKFRVSSTGLPGGTVGLLVRAFWITDESFAAYDSKYLSVGAVDVFQNGSNGNKRPVSWYQIAGVDSTGKVSISGNYPSLSGSVAGLVKDQKSSSSTGALVDGGSSSNTAPAVVPVIAVNVSGDEAAGRKWSDGTYAVSCSGYLNAPSGKTYAGSTGNGTYWIDADGVGGGAAFKAYCDMTTDGGGWTFLATDSAQITAGKYSTVYNDSTNPIMSCSTVAASTQVVMYSGVMASNCNAYNLTAADLTCVNDKIALGTSGILKWSYYGNFSHLCVDLGDRCPGTSKAHNIAWRCK